MQSEASPIAAHNRRIVAILNRGVTMPVRFRHALIVIAMLILTACNPAVIKYNSYQETNKPLAVAGQMKWSDYYKGLFQIAADSKGVANAGDTMEILNTLINASLAFEDSKLSKSEFESIQRSGAIAIEKSKAALDTASQAAWGQALKNYGNTVYGSEATRAKQVPIPPPYQPPPPANMQCSTNNGVTNCRTY
jgi:hypothetical protein